MGAGRRQKILWLPVFNSLLFFILLLLPSLSVSAETPPQTLSLPPGSPQTSDPYLIFNKHYQAIGGLDKLRQIKTSYSEGRSRYDGLQGTFKHWDRRPLEYRTEEDYTTISQVEGDTGEFAWLYDTNNQLLIHKHPAVLKRRQIALLLDSYEHLKRDSRYFSLNYIGIKEVGEASCHEILLTNSINSDKILFYFDNNTFFLLQSISEQPDTKIVTQYDDFRHQDEVVLSFHQKTTYYPWNKKEETWVTRHVNNAVVKESFFQPPESIKDYRFTGGDRKSNSTSIPFLFVENLIYLPVTINGDQKYWVLDSGASMSLIDTDYAQSLGLEPEGSIQGYGFGELFELRFVTVPEYRVGNIVFDTQKLYTNNGLAAKSYEPVIYGILGYDFLSRFVVEIDYDNLLVTLHRPGAFIYEGIGDVIDAPLRYRTFTVPVLLNNKYKSRWSLDLGAYRSSIHYPFAEKNKLLQTAGVDSVSQGLASISREKTSQFDCLQINDFSLPGPLLNIPLSKGKGATALGEIGGNLGNSTLKRFHVWLDYPRQQIILEKGDQFYTPPPRDKSGILLGRSHDDDPMVSFVAGNSPAEKVGVFAGDIVLELNGIQTTHTKNPITVVALRNLLRQPAGTKIDMKLRRDHQTLSVNFTLQNLFPEESGGCTLQN